MMAKPKDDPVKQAMMVGVSIDLTSHSFHQAQMIGLNRRLRIHHNNSWN
jgi:hypothetical protein